MKTKMLTLSLIVLIAAACAQDKSKRPSPPAVASGTIDGVNIKIDYSQPSVKGRKIMGGLVPYGEVWRTGANEATTIEFDKNVKIEGQPLPAGKYTLFTIPGEKEWSIIFNKKLGQWGAYDYEKNKGENALVVKVKPASTAFTEVFTFEVGAKQVTLKWENTAVSFGVSKN
ncbi:MAG: DUF2911 domain-containing protein [Cyclobacteriaceae bacterium]|nr:DUF2911 domain-containing protein [Cyclobacteriaceae bacterium]MDW8332108.1 DUF2911 domain-containing protein [Cyclobacteriaceae bacterium]